MTNSDEEKRKKSKHSSFLTDGFITERDFLIVVSVGVFFLFVTVALIMILFQQEIAPMYLELLDMVSPVIMTIVASIFSVNVAEIIANRPKRESAKEVKKESESPVEPKQEQNPDFNADDIV